MFPTAPASQKTVSNDHIHNHRPRLERHYVQIPHVVLRGFDDLSDGAKLTYLVLLSFDYVDPETGAHKGIVYPSIETLMTLRHKSRSTIYSHLTELEKHGLVEVLIGEGFRLYNPQEGAFDEGHIQKPSSNEKTATANHSAQEHPSGTDCEAQPHRDSGCDASRLTFQKSGRGIIEEKENLETKQYHYSEVGENYLVVDKLLKLEFDPLLARQFVTRYGATHVDEQITNLCRALQHGALIRSYPRWLYRAIERDYIFTDDAKGKAPSAPKMRRSIGQAKTLENGDVVYEVVEYVPAG